MRSARGPPPTSARGRRGSETTAASRTPKTARGPAKPLQSAATPTPSVSARRRTALSTVRSSDDVDLLAAAHEHAARFYRVPANPLLTSPDSSTAVPASSKTVNALTPSLVPMTAALEPFSRTALAPASPALANATDQSPPTKRRDVAAVARYPQQPLPPATAAEQSSQPPRADCGRDTAALAEELRLFEAAGSPTGDVGSGSFTSATAMAPFLRFESGDAENSPPHRSTAEPSKPTKATDDDERDETDSHRESTTLPRREQTMSSESNEPFASPPQRVEKEKATEVGGAEATPSPARERSPNPVHAVSPDTRSRQPDCLSGAVASRETRSPFAVAHHTVDHAVQSPTHDAHAPSLASPNGAADEESIRQQDDADSPTFRTVTPATTHAATDWSTIRTVRYPPEGAGITEPRPQADEREGTRTPGGGGDMADRSPPSNSASFFTEGVTPSALKVTPPVQVDDDASPCADGSSAPAAGPDSSSNKRDGEHASSCSAADVERSIHFSPIVVRRTNNDGVEGDNASSPTSRLQESDTRCPSEGDARQADVDSPPAAPSASDDTGHVDATAMLADFSLQQPPVATNDDDDGNRCEPVGPEVTAHEAEVVVEASLATLPAQQNEDSELRANKKKEEAAAGCCIVA